MLVVTRYRVDDPAPADRGSAAFLTEARAALAALAARPGFRSGRIGRAADDPAMWVVVTEWAHVGAYRRALSAYDVRVHAVPLLSRAVDEPSAYEVLVSTGQGGDPGSPSRASHRALDADVVGLGEASAPDVPTDLAR